MVPGDSIGVSQPAEGSHGEPPLQVAVRAVHGAAERGDGFRLEICSSGDLLRRTSVY